MLLRSLQLHENVKAHIATVCHLVLKGILQAKLEPIQVNSGIVP